MKRNKGITLIALIITIIVLLILAGVALNILIGEGSIIENANSSVDKYNNSVTKEQEDLNKLASYFGDDTTDTDTATLPEGTASEVVDDVTCYGVTVANYEDPAGDPDVGWEIFYVSTADEEYDGQSHIYLIADDYISYTYCPSTTNYSISKGDTDYVISLDEVYQDYEGSVSITDPRIQKWIQEYLDVAPESTEKNIRKTAYLLDNNIWDKYYKNSAYADYTIGGVTLEMLVKSYNKKYEVEWYYGVSGSTAGYGIQRYCATSDELYILADVSKAGGYYLGAPGSANATTVTFCFDNYTDSYLLSGDGPFSGRGLRPLVCLNSNVKLVDNGDGTYNLSVEE